MNTLNILFWNINKKNLTALIGEYVSNYSVDVLVLIEDKTPISEMLRSLNKTINRYHYCKSNDRKISIYTSFDRTLFDFPNIVSTEFISLVEFKLANKSVLFGGIHLPSKMTTTTASHQAYVARKTKEDIELAENELKHSNTLIVGDFNMNPFEEGMVEPESFNSVMCRKIASVDARNVNGLGTGLSSTYKYFYNPMWSFLGDLSKFSPGTYYLYGNDYKNHYRWNMLDQILIRPDIISSFVPGSLKIIDKDSKGGDLIDTNLNYRKSSQLVDHLPVFFTMNF